MTSALNYLSPYDSGDQFGEPAERQVFASGVRAVPAAYVESIRRPKYTQHESVRCQVGYQFPHASPGSDTVPDEKTVVENTVPELGQQKEGTVSFEMQKSCGPLNGTEDLEHLAPSPPVLCQKPYTVWESYQPKFVGRGEAAGPMVRRLRTPINRHLTQCRDDVRMTIPIPNEHARLRDTAVYYTTPEAWIPREEARSKPNPPLRVDPGEDTSVVHPNFRIWRNSDACLEYGPLSDKATESIEAAGWQQTKDAEGKSAWVEKTTGRISYRMSDQHRM